MIVGNEHLIEKKHPKKWVLLFLQTYIFCVLLIRGDYIMANADDIVDELQKLNENLNQTGETGLGEKIEEAVEDFGEAKGATEDAIDKVVEDVKDAVNADR